MKKKILFFCPIPPPFHGSNYMSKLIIDELKRYDHFEIKHINTQFSAEIKNLGKFSAKKTILFFKYLFQLVYIIISSKPVYIIMVPAFVRNPFIVNYIYVFIASVILKKKVLLWINSNNIKLLYDSSGIILKKLIRNIFNFSYLIISCSSKLYELNYNFFSQKEKVITIHNAIPNVYQVKKTRKDYNIIITYLSTMDLTKGWKILFDAAELICKEYENVYFNFYGSSAKNSPLDYIYKTFNSSKFSDKIKYCGPIYGLQKEEVLYNSDIFCFPTSMEAFPLSILEAMSCSLPIITTNVGGITEAVIDGKGGFIIEKIEPEVLAEKLKILINNKELREKFGEFNRQRFLENFNLEIVTKKWVKLLENDIKIN